MDVELIGIYSDTFDDIVENIKQANLPGNNMPELIVGTGLSVIYDVSGMKVLTEHLGNEIDKSPKRHLREM